MSNNKGPANIPQGQLSEALNVSQAACYAAIAVQYHQAHDPIYIAMTPLVERLAELALRGLEEGKIDQPLPDPTASDTVQ